MKNKYIQEKGYVENKSHMRNLFSQIVSEHALYMTQLVLANKNEKTFLLMQIWIKLEKLNQEWVNLITGRIVNENEFYFIVKNLVFGYTRFLGEFIIKGKKIGLNEKVDRIIELETKFYTMLSRNKSEDLLMELSKQWTLYTSCLINLRNIKKEEIFYERGLDCIIIGGNLGTILDNIIFSI